MYFKYVNIIESQLYLYTFKKQKKQDDILTTLMPIHLKISTKWEKFLENIKHKDRS